MNTTSHTWNFFRAGGFDQVQLASGADLLALKDLDQKLWVALSCPTRGIEFDSKTLDMIDSDGDGKVRANEVLAALAWAGSLLKNADLLVAGYDVLPLHEINDSSDEGRQVLASARHILRSLNKVDALEISLADMHDIERLIASLEFNGDGVVTPEQISDNSLRSTVADAMQCVGSVADLSGAIGINAELNEQFFSELESYAAWHKTADATVLLLGENTATAAVAFNAVQAKINDYFMRCQLAAYDVRAAEPLSRAASDYEQLAAESLSLDTMSVANFPLASIAANKALPLCEAVNPSWQAAITALRNKVVLPLLGDKKTLSASDWTTLCENFSAYASWQSAQPTNRVEVLGMSRIDEILHSGAQAKISTLIAQDAAVAEEVKAIRSVEKLLRYQRDLFLLSNNFVSFRNFYTGKDKAIFQVGTLFLDGRSCELCIKIDDVAQHASFASSSGVCLAYCECVRDSGKEKMTIAAAFTAGDSDFLMVGRNGIFYDRQGRDWDAQIVRIIDNPISIRQAFFSPYKKAVKMISAQIQKLAASKASAVDEKLMSSAVDHSKTVAAPATPAKAAFDVGKFAGIFAAIGLAVGAIGGILASLVAGVLTLKIWQMPLALIGLMLMISGPSMILAWFKLKNRNLAPILDANGWAINARALINIPFGTSLTQMPHLPAGAHRSLLDPFAEKKSLWPLYVVIALGIAALAVLWNYGFFGHRA